MKTYDRCFECLRKSVNSQVAKLVDDPKLRKEIEAEAIKVMKKEDFSKSPPFFGREVYWAIRKISGIVDPYSKEKEEYNRIALSAYPALKERVAKAEDSFTAAVRIALAGNIIDFGAIRKIPLEETIEAMLRTGPVVDHTQNLKQAVQNARRILYLGDNAGETVMDRILIEQFDTRADIVYAVRGGPILNDAQIEDALFAGLDKVVRIISNGYDAPGTILDKCNKEFILEFEKADLIISKGMGNFETLSDLQGRPIFFLLIAKCPIVADHLDCEVGQAVVKQAID